MLYQIRRKLQRAAYSLTSQEFVSRVYFRHELGYRLNLRDPQTFNEKLQWLKLYAWPGDERVIQCADKYAVRSYVESVGKADLLNELIGVWEDAWSIDWEKLPEKFALKCNHGCAYNLICQDKSRLSENAVKKQFDKWMHEAFGHYNAEPHYDRIPRKIICEKFLDGDIINYNIYVLNGRVVFFSVAGGLGDGVGEHLTYYHADGTPAGFKNRNYPVHAEKLTPLLPQMEETAVFLAKGFPMVRVDLFDIDGRIVLSEMTFTPGGALIPFDSYEADKWLGEQLDIDMYLRGAES